MQNTNTPPKKRIQPASSSNDWDHIRKELRDFVQVYQHTKYERGQAQPYWNKLFRCYGITEDILSKAFEHRLKLGKKNNYVDAFIPGKLIVEHKGSHIQLSTAFEQLQGYFALLPPSEQPRYAVLCNFQHIRLYDFSNLAKPVITECLIQDLPERAELFKFLLPDEEETGFLAQPSIDQKAAQAIADLHLVLNADRYTGRELEVFLTRLIFCYFADDTGIFGENTQFHRLLLSTKADGSDLGMVFSQLFQVLNTPHDKRSTRLSGALQNFAYINGQLFNSQQAMPEFDADMRTEILRCSALNWGNINPSIFGSMFQAVLETGRAQDVSRTASRRELGAHYTSESNILRAIKPLFLDELRAALEKAAKNKTALQALHKRLAGLTIFDPACGCGNFLVIAFQQLRLLEIEIAHRLYGNAKKSMGLLDIREILRVRVNQFYGIEIDESAAHIARVALWITDHQMNLVAAQRLGQTRPSVPLIDSATIVEGNALTTDWTTVLPAQRCSYVIGNPPFIGKKEQTADQKACFQPVMKALHGAGVLDFVAAWYVKASRYVQAAPNVRVAFVSTNSITQGEQVGVLWGWMLAQGMRIQFAHRTFQWSNDAKGVAAVHCVIIGFGVQDLQGKVIFEYPAIKGEPVDVAAHNINPYLIDAPNVVLPRRSRPICDVPSLIEGITPLDNGILAFTEAQYKDFVAQEPKSASWFKPWMTGNDFINGYKSYCLWLSGAAPSQLKTMPAVMSLIAKVKTFRENSKSSQKFAATPWLFRETTIPEKYILIPKTSSERREFLPLGFVENVVVSNSGLYMDGGGLYHFGVMCSTMHNAWLRLTGGRLKSDLRYSASIVYNNYPWPQLPEATTEQPSSPEVQRLRKAIETMALSVIKSREEKKNQTLGDLYDRLTMPVALRNAHKQLDKAVDAAYGYKGTKDDAARVAFLFERYVALTAATAPVASTEPASKKPMRKKAASHKAVN